MYLLMWQNLIGYMLERDTSKHPGMSLPRRLVHEHGHIGAHVASLLRIPGAHLVRHYLKEGEYNKALVSYLGVSALDWLDGELARGSREGGSQFGGRIDDLSDKYVAAVVEKTMTEKDMMDREDFYGRTLRDVAMTVYQRPKAKRKGHDVSAVSSGKKNTWARIATNALSMTEFVQDRPLVKTVLQKGSTAGSWVSYHLSPIQWEEKHNRKLHAEASGNTIFDAKAA